MSDSESHRNKWALLIGIDRYPNFRQLAGCINDVEVMRQVLIDSFNFPESHVALLTDEQATRGDHLRDEEPRFSGSARMTSSWSTTAAMGPR